MAGKVLKWRFSSLQTTDARKFIEHHRTIMDGGFSIATCDYQRAGSCDSSMDHINVAKYSSGPTSKCDTIGQAGTEL